MKFLRLRATTVVFVDALPDVFHHLPRSGEREYAAAGFGDEFKLPRPRSAWFFLLSPIPT